MAACLRAAFLFLAAAPAWAQAPAPVAPQAPSAAYAACMDRAATTVAMIDCNQAERRRWAVRLDQAEQALLAQLDPEGQRLLREAGRRWAAWRDAECAARAYAEAGGGSMSGIIGSSCQRELTAERAVLLEDLRNR